MKCWVRALSRIIGGATKVLEGKDTVSFFSLCFFETIPGTRFEGTWLGL